MVIKMIEDLKKREQSIKEIIKLFKESMNNKKGIDDMIRFHYSSEIYKYMKEKDISAKNISYEIQEILPENYKNDDYYKYGRKLIITISE